MYVRASISGQGTWCLLTVGPDLEDYAISGGSDVGGVEVFVDHHPGGATVPELVATENPGHTLEAGQIVEILAQPGPIYHQGVVS
jgi:hypothetical protein